MVIENLPTDPTVLIEQQPRRRSSLGDQIAPYVTEREIVDEEERGEDLKSNVS